MNDNVTVANLSNSDHWLRLLFTVIYALIFWLGLWVAGAAVVLNILALLFTGSRNEALTDFGKTVTDYLSEILRYATQVSDVRPFPFATDEVPPEPATEAEPVKTGPTGANPVTGAAPAATARRSGAQPQDEPAKTGAADKATPKKKKKTTARKKKTTKKVSSDKSD